jgi:hypothetical protein
MPEQEQQEEQEQEGPKLGGPTAKEMGTEYELISPAGKSMVTEDRDAGPTGNNPEGRVDIGREPMYYAEKHTPPGKLGEQDAGREQPQADESDRPGTAEPRSGAPD